MQRLLIPCVAALMAACSHKAAQQSVADPPQAARRPVTDTYFETTVTEEYRWLEDGAAPEVKAWATAQTARARQYLDALPYRAALETRLLDLLSRTAPYYFGLKPAGNQVFAYFRDPVKQQPMLAVLDRSLDPATARIVLDPNAMDTTGALAIDWLVPSPDGKTLAVSLSRNGSEDGDLHFYDVASGSEIGKAIPDVQHATAGGDVAWSGDGRTVYYTRYPGTERPEADRNFFQTLWVHNLDGGADRQLAIPGLPRIAEIKLQYSDAAQALLVTVQNGDGGEFAHYLVAKDGGVRQVTHFADGATIAALGPDGALYLVSQQGAPHRQLLKLARGQHDLKRARVIVPALDDAVIISDFWGGPSFAFYGGDRMAVRYMAGGPTRLRSYNLDGGDGFDLPIPEVADVSEVVSVGGELVYSVETYLAPFSFHRYANGKSTPTALRMASPVNFDDLEVLRSMAQSRDGTQVPVNIIRRKGLKLDGSHPMLLYGYGGYGVNETPYFLGGAQRLWFDAGGVYAVANLRGGGEFGEEWHMQGALTHKQNVFDDFTAAAQLLLDQRYTSPQRLAIRGGSNGGLLMGAALTQHASMFRAVVSSVGIYDMLRVELDPNGEFNIPEFGSVKNRGQFDALYAYSPYHRVVDGTAYPAVLMQTGENDGRVNPMQSRKMTARLQAATSSQQPILLLTTDAAGHGIGSPLKVRVAQSADYLAFLFDQLGMDASPR
jgi:prolyl oligopeptidase